MGKYFRLVDFDSQTKKEEAFLNAVSNADCGYVYNADLSNFSKIPGAPIAYWASKNLIIAFEESPSLISICEPRQGVITGDNERFLRLWYEVSSKKIAFKYSAEKKWYPINKGGEFRKWYGNREYIINWELDGFEIKNFKDEKGKVRSRPQNLTYNFQPALSWSLITSGGFSVRAFDEDFMFNVAGISCFPNSNITNYLNALLNSKVVDSITKIINPTLNMNVGDIARLPIIVRNNIFSIVENCVIEQLEISKTDWDSYETSWDFKKHPLV